MSAVSRSYELTFEKRRNYVYALIRTRMISRSMALDHLSDIADQCAIVRCKRLMIERDVPAMPTHYALDAIRDFVAMSDGMKVAIVNRHASAGDGLRELAQSSHEGAATAYFSTVEDAEKWLLDDGEE